MRLESIHVPGCALMLLHCCTWTISALSTIPHPSTILYCLYHFAFLPPSSPPPAYPPLHLLRPFYSPTEFYSFSFFILFISFTGWSTHRWEELYRSGCASASDCTPVRFYWPHASRNVIAAAPYRFFIRNHYPLSYGSATSGNPLYDDGNTRFVTDRGSEDRLERPRDHLHARPRPCS